MKDAYVASLQARGKDAAYIDGVFVNINTGTFFISMIAILVCAVLGGWFGQRMMKKHFIKAGICLMNPARRTARSGARNSTFCWWRTSCCSST